MHTFERTPYVTLHGPDGSGKTTVARTVVQALNREGHGSIFFDDWKQMQGRENPFSAAEIKLLSGEGKGLSVLQLAKVAFDSVAISELTDSGIIVVKDRGLLDVRADLAYRGLDPNDCSGPLVREPDLAVFLSVSEAARHKRLAVKEDIRPEDFQPNEPGSRLFSMVQHVQSSVETLEPANGLLIDTDELGVDQVVERVCNEVLDRL